jgi:hypothetical protein
MKKALIAVAFVVSGLPAWRWALPPDWWSKVDACLPPNTHAFVAQMSIEQCAAYIRPFAAVWLILFIFDLIANQTIGTGELGKDPHTGFEAVDEGVPHSRFRWQQDGFTATMSNHDGLARGFLWFFLTLVTIVIWYFVAGITTGLVLTLILGSALSYFAAERTPTRVKVTSHAIFIRDHKESRKLDRNHFACFMNYGNWLGFTYGRRNFPFGGRMGGGAIVEIAAALNQLMESGPPAHRATPSATYVPRTKRSEF